MNQKPGEEKGMWWLGFLAFELHEPWLLFNFCLFALFTYFGFLKEELKYLGLLGILGLIIAILGLAGLLTVWGIDDAAPSE